MSERWGSETLTFVSVLFQGYYSHGRNWRKKSKPYRNFTLISWNLTWHWYVSLVYYFQVLHDSYKRPMGHIHHLRKQFKSINMYDYIIMLIKRRKTPLFFFYENLMVLHLYKLMNPLSSKDALCQVWLKLTQTFWRRFLNFGNVFCYFIIIFPWKRTGAFTLMPTMTTMTTTTTDIMDKFWSEKLTWALSSGEHKMIVILWL